MTERHEIWAVADALQMDLRAASAKLVELRARLAGLDLPDASSVRCPHCGIPCKGPRTLADHVYIVHDGPNPDADFDAVESADSGSLTERSAAA